MIKNDKLTIISFFSISRIPVNRQLLTVNCESQTVNRPLCPVNYEPQAKNHKL